jgi:hypothetical protein
MAFIATITATIAVAPAALRGQGGSMLYRAHLISGLGLGTALAGAAYVSGSLIRVEDLAAVAGLTTVFALLPDLDTASIVQRWFYRGMLGVLVWLMATGRAEHAAFLGAVSLLPLVHRHRGWTHAWWATIAVPLAALLLWDAYAIARVPRDFTLDATLASLGSEVMARWSQVRGARAPYAAAMVAGYALHLAVDFHAPAWLKWGRLL